MKSLVHKLKSSFLLQEPIFYHGEQARYSQILYAPLLYLCVWVCV